MQNPDALDTVNVPDRLQLYALRLVHKGDWGSIAYQFQIYENQIEELKQALDAARAISTRLQQQLMYSADEDHDQTERDNQTRGGATP